MQQFIGVVKKPVCDENVPPPSLMMADLLRENSGLPDERLEERRVCANVMSQDAKYPDSKCDLGKRVSSFGREPLGSLMNDAVLMGSRHVSIQGVTDVSADFLDDDEACSNIAETISRVDMASHIRQLRDDLLGEASVESVIIQAPEHMSVTPSPDRSRTNALSPIPPSICDSTASGWPGANIMSTSVNDVSFDHLCVPDTPVPLLGLKPVCASLHSQGVIGPPVSLGTPLDPASSTSRCNGNWWDKDDDWIAERAVFFPPPPVHASDTLFHAGHFQPWAPRRQGVYRRGL